VEKGSKVKVIGKYRRGKNGRVGKPKQDITVITLTRHTAEDGGAKTYTTRDFKHVKGAPNHNKFQTDESKPVFSQCKILKRKLLLQMQNSEIQLRKDHENTYQKKAK
jgi:hypothetical protein